MIHKEGFGIIIIVAIILLIINIISGYLLATKPIVTKTILLCSVLILAFILNFFRNPSRPILQPDNSIIYSPADGTVVAIEECEEPEYFKEKKLKISIFMSIWNVHCNRIPVDGTIIYFKYHKGKFFIASKPKASTDNERTTTVIKTPTGKEILVRQIAGILARRIKTNKSTGETVKQGEELGFIRFGSRVDVYLPLNTPVLIKNGDKVKGNISKLATI